MGEPGCHSLADALCLALVFRCVVGDAVEDEDLAPLCALVEGGEQLVDDLGVDVQDLTGCLRGLHDLGDSSDGIGHNLKEEKKKGVDIMN